MPHTRTRSQTQLPPKMHKLNRFMLRKLMDQQAKFHFAKRDIYCQVDFQQNQQNTQISHFRVRESQNFQSQAVSCLISFQFLVQMSVVLTCAHKDEPQPFIGIDPSCSQPAVFCVQHSPHTNKQGLLHQMMPLGQFRRALNQQKFRMADKVATLTDQYSAFMDQLIAQINELKLRKVVELSMLWLRELASTEEEYESLRRIYRNDYEGLTCKEAHNLYFKVVGNDTLAKKKLEEIECYREICGVMATLQSSVKAKMAIMEKVGELEGVVQQGQLLKRALPDRRVLKQNTKEILLQPKVSKYFQVKYNRVVAKENSRNFQSVFSKYPLIQHTNYHLLITTKYTNILLGICGEALKQGQETTDLHYNINSIVFNCSNGCLYRDGMFQSGSSHLTKGQKVLQLILRTTDREMIILLGKNVVCRANIQGFKKGKIFLHLLMRTQGDAIEIDRDKITLPSQEPNVIISEPPSNNHFSDAVIEQVSAVSIPAPPSLPSGISSPKNSIDRAISFNKNFYEPQNTKIVVQRKSVTPIDQILRQNMKRRSTLAPTPIAVSPAPIDSAPMYQSLFQKQAERTAQQLNPNSNNLIQSIGLKKSLPFGGNSNRQSKHFRPEQRSQVNILVENSMVASEAEEVQSRYASNVYMELPVAQEPVRESLINPAPLRKSQFQYSLRSSAMENKLQPFNASPLPSMKMLQKRTSGLADTLNGIRVTQMQDDWI